MNFDKSINDQLRDIMKPTKICPLCGSSNIKVKVSFKGRNMHRNKRKTEYCPCGWSSIVPTEREAMTQLGLV